METHVGRGKVPDVKLGRLHGGFSAVHRFDLLEICGKRSRDIRRTGAEFKEAVFTVRMYSVLDAHGEVQPCVLDAGRPVQNMHAEACAGDRHKVVAEGAFGFNLHSLSIGGVEKPVGEALNLVAADDFGATAFDEIDKRLVAVRGEFPFDIHLDEKRKASVACGSEPNLAQCFLEYVEMVFVKLFHDTVHKLDRLHVAGRSVDGQELLFPAVFVDNSPVGMLGDGVGGKPGLQLSWNAVVFHPC